MELYGIKLIGVNAQVGEKLLFTVGLFIVVAILRWMLQQFARRLFSGHGQTRTRFWTRQAVNLSTALLFLVVLLSVWFDNPSNLGIAVGLVTAGLAFALQKVILSLAGYIVILRGNTFNVGDRIAMGGVRGDVIALDFLFTTIMEIGQLPSVRAYASTTWVMGRQYTGRLVSVANGQIFDEPVFNYSRDFPYIWDEIHVPIAYADDRTRAEQILLDAAARHTQSVQQLGRAAVDMMLRRYAIPIEDLEPRVFYRITDNWLELALRFVAHDRNIRDLKDAMSRDILREFDKAGIGIASATYDIVGFPPLRLDQRFNSTPKPSAPDQQQDDGSEHV
ncbi:MAG: mechanosensitive ion channel family protein [Candidatus Eremiobacteraeota bacterium]|nr:mechanosensitive ion channel family protein [Candidatus Eremiobacteraeota bacterium]